MPDRQTNWITNLLNGVSKCGLILQDMSNQKASQAGEPREAGALFQAQQQPDAAELGKLSGKVEFTGQPQT